MSTTRRISATAVAVLALTLTACATPRADAPAAAPPPPKLGDVRPAPPTSDIVAQGTVMDDAGEISLCTGPMTMIYPPQCSGIPLEGWDWAAADGEESAEGRTWGTYAVTGGFDGERITVTAPPIPLALYDPMAPEDPTGGAPGKTDEATLAEIQQTVTDRLGDEVQVAYVENGYVHVQVLWDDGTYQDAADAEFGDDVVIVTTLLQPVS
ncbi:hypothetical protein E4U02_03515 [Microbacterium paludicola]|uniref:DUF3558 domain-containing protein n=1 Tax=Microbacterium paludicola TaxID=300019 RepID=A0A4Y9FZ92_9MICO|nr:hypothetical protein [Microbacterium paludicola]MBF0815475.1 hypothetical protein [Microbacterium paludicola]TFU34009.1 hypothetical protein E4U02_03515 [Microbacterium paludicola]